MLYLFILSAILTKAIVGFFILFILRMSKLSFISEANQKLTLCLKSRYKFRCLFSLRSLFIESKISF